jgi:sec-independent protein translocase protein TatC
MVAFPWFRRKTDEERTGSMTVIEHLQELRHRIIVSLVAIGLGSVAGWVLYGPFIDLVQGPFCEYLEANPEVRAPSGCSLTYLGPTDAFVLKLKVVVFLGLLAALPVVLYQAWAFVVPGLTRRERRWALPFIAASTVLFFLGAVFAYVTLPRALDFLLGFAGEAFAPSLTGDRYIGFIVLVTLAFGLAFLLPIFLIFLQLAHVLSSARLARWRRYAILVISIFAAVITPSGDPYTMLAMMIPMYLFYEASIIVGRSMKR